MSENTIPLFKMNGAGNKILVLDLRADGKSFSGKMASALGEQDGLQFDQLMTIEPAVSPNTAAFMHIYNIDGSQAEACGNGTRCLADVLLKAEDGDKLVLESIAGLLAVKRNSDTMLTVDMGIPKFDWQDIPLAEEFRDTRMIELQVGPIDQPILHSPSVVNMGNPHAIFWVGRDVYSYDLDRFGPLLENHPIFPDKANISIARIISDHELDLRVWERGVGLTLACGSAACAAAVSAARTKRTGRMVDVNMPGGQLTIEWLVDDHVLMTGPVAYEAAGVLNLDTMESGLVETDDPFELAKTH